MYCRAEWPPVGLRRDAGSCLLPDALGSTRYLADASGTASGLSSFDAFGSLRSPAVILINAGDWESARPLNTEAVELARIVAAPDQVAILLSNQANFALQLDRDPATAAALAEEGLDWARQAQSEDVVMTMLLGLTEMRMEAGDLDGAEATHAEAIELDAALGDWHGEIGYTQLHSARLALARGDIDQAAADLAQNAVFLRRVFEEDDTQLSIAAQPLHLWAEVAIRLSKQTKAVTLLGAQAAWYETTHRTQMPAEQAAAQDTLSRARAGFDPEIFHEAWEQGTNMSGPEALDYALDQLRSDV